MDFLNISHSSVLLLKLVFLFGLQTASSSKKEKSQPASRLALPTMEAFTLLKYWHALFAAGAGDTAKITSDGGEDGPYFDLEFPLDDDPVKSLFARENCFIRDSDPDRRRLSKEFVQRYLKLLKPLNYVEKMKCSGRTGGHSGGDSGDTPPFTEGGEATMVSRRISGGLPTSGLKVMLKHLGKSRSSSGLAGTAAVHRGGDALVEAHDGIQGAIMYCKRSYSMPNSN